jgi:hypothetical protein
MYLEFLANELLLDLFEYLDGIYLLRAFNGLNSRFNYLLFVHFRSYHFDFRSITKYDFDIICKDYFPLIINRIKSFTLSNDDETPNLPELFLSYGFTINKFIGLQFLSLYSIESYDQLNQIIIQCYQIPYLTHLNIMDTYIDDGKKEITDLMNNIWRLPRLYHLNFNNNSLGKTYLSKISIISLSIKKLFIENVSCSLEDLLHLIKQTPSIEHLSITIHYNFQDEQIPIIISSIKFLKLTFESRISILKKLFQITPNLISLKIKTMDIYLNGNKWKKILRNYLTKLKIFQFRMYFEFPQQKNIHDEFDKLINTYKTSFWIEKHQWYIACDCIPFGTSYHGIVYTLPYSFDQFISYNIFKSKSTCSNKSYYGLFNQVKNLQYMKYETNLIDYSNFLLFQFPNIRYLKIGIPFDEHFWSFIPSLNRLHSLEAILGENYSHEQLQNLINLSSNLYSLRIFYSLESKIIITQIISSSIRRLNLIPECSSSRGYFNNNECAYLAYSQLGQKCEVLLIKIENRNNVLDLIKTMNNLRSLIFQCQDDLWINRNSTSIEDEFIQWLRISLPSTYLINRDKNEQSNIRIWIGDNRKNARLSL